MTRKLNDTQKELMILAKEKGYLTIDDFKMQYTSLMTIKANIERFKLMGLLKDSEKVTGKFDYLGEKNE